jgi:DNA repair protein RadA/Sms
VLVGDAAHETHARRGIEGPTRAAAGNRSVYFDEADGTKRVRIRTHIEGLDRVLGGGLVGDSIILLTGEKGAGKSTLLLQIVDAVLRQGHSALYVAAEENASQVAERAKRLGVAMHGRVLHTTDLDDFYDDLERLRSTEDDPDLVIVDSAQTIGDLGDMAVGQIGSVA